MRLISSIAAGVAALGLAGVAGAEPPAPGERPTEAGASNMGICSSYLGQTGHRAAVNHLILEFGPVLGVESPGELYRQRAKERNEGTPEEECLPRQF